MGAGAGRGEDDQSEHAVPDYLTNEDCLTNEANAEKLTVERGFAVEGEVLSSRYQSPNYPASGHLISEENWKPDDFAALWSNDTRVRARCAKDESETIELALRTLATADLRGEILADTGIYGPATRTHRILGARILDYAVIAAQPSISGTEGPNWLRVGRPENLGEGIASCIPKRAVGRPRFESL